MVGRTEDIKTLFLIVFHESSWRFPHREGQILQYAAKPGARTIHEFHAAFSQNGIIGRVPPTSFPASISGSSWAMNIKIRLPQEYLKGFYNFICKNSLPCPRPAGDPGTEGNFSVLIWGGKKGPRANSRGACRVFELSHLQAGEWNISPEDNRPCWENGSFVSAS